MTSLVFVVLMQGVACRVTRISPSRLAAAGCSLYGLAIVLVAGPLCAFPRVTGSLRLRGHRGIAATTAVLAVGYRPLLVGSRH